MNAKRSLITAVALACPAFLLLTAASPVLEPTLALGPAPPAIQIITDGSASPSEAAAILAGVLDEGEYGAHATRSVSTVADFREAVLGARAPILVVIGHGEREGLRLDGETLAWTDLKKDIEESGAKQVVLLACGSAAIGKIEGVEILKAYEADVDVEVAALDAAFEIGKRNLDSTRLARFKDAHNAVVAENGGAIHYFHLMVEPARPLSEPREDTDSWCDYTYNSWQYPGSMRYVGPPNPTCYTLPVWDSNLACMRPPRNQCHGVQPEEEQQLERTMEKGSSVTFKFGQQFSFLDGLIAVGHDATIDGTRYSIYATVGGMDKSQKPIMKGVGASGTCIVFGDLSNLVMPGVQAATEVLSKIPGVTIQVDVLQISSCVTLSGGVVWGQTKGFLKGTIDIRAESGVAIIFDVWWAPTVSDQTKLSIKYPFGMNEDITIDVANDRVNLDGTFQWGPLSVQLKSNVFHIYLGADIPFTSGKSDASHWDFSCLGLCRALGGQSNARLEPPIDTLPELDVSASVAKAQGLIPELVVLRAPEEVAHVSPEVGDRRVKIADVLELKPGDAVFNGFQASGGFERLGIDAKSIPVGNSILVDLANPDVYEALYGEASTRPLAVLGIPGGWQQTSSTCTPSQFGALVVIYVQNCDPNRPIASVSIIETAPEVLGVAPLEIVESQIAPLSNTAGRTAHVICLGQGLITSPTSGHTYSLREVCDNVAYDAALGQGFDAVHKAAKIHNVRQILQGTAHWITDACSVRPTTGAVRPTFGCMKLWTTATDLFTGLPLDAFAVVDQFQRGVIEIEKMTDGTRVSNNYGLIGNGFLNWAAGEPTHQLLADEIADPGGIPSEVFRIEHELECDVWEAIGQHPQSCA